jgi:hypothetical protein
MHDGGSFLRIVIDRIRGYLDDPDIDAKYSDDFIVRHVIGPCMTDVISRINHNWDNPVVVRHVAGICAGQPYYQLPPSIGEIWRVCTTDDQGNIIDDWKPRGEWNPNGPLWSIEGNLLSFRPLPRTDVCLEIFYVPNGDVSPHMGTGHWDAENKVFTMGATPTLGAIDRRPNAYAGQVLRLLPTNTYVEERVIGVHDVVHGVLQPRIAFHHESGEMPYEIAPIGAQSLYEAIASSGALKLGAYRKISGTHYQMILRQYQSAIKTVGDNLSNLQMRTAKAWDRNTVDSWID